MRSKFTFDSNRNSKKELMERRHEKFDRVRKLQTAGKGEQMETEADKQFEENIEMLDYSTLYPENVRIKLNLSLHCEIPQPLPPLDFFTISLYRRAGKSVYQCRQTGSKQLDPHMTYQSLLMLGHNQANRFGNFQAVTREFQRDLVLYLKMNSKDIQQMAVIAAGNKVLGREEDIFGILEGQKDAQFLWVLINNVYQNKISCRYLFPYFLNNNQLAFKAFSELTNKIGDFSILVLVESDEALDLLLKNLSSPSPDLQLASIEILCNILGEGQGYWKLFTNTNLIDQCCFLLQTQKTLKLAILKLLCNFAFEEGGATALLRNDAVFSLLWSKLQMESSKEECCEFLNIFSFLTYKASIQGQEQFDKLVSPQLLDICHTKMLLDSENVKLSAMQLVCGVVELGQKFLDENDRNRAVLYLSQKQELVSKIEENTNSDNELIRGLCYFILDKAAPMDEEEQIAI